MGIRINQRRFKKHRSLTPRLHHPKSNSLALGRGHLYFPPRTRTTGLDSQLYDGRIRSASHPLCPCLALLMLSVEEREGREIKNGMEGGKEGKEGRRNDKQPPYGGHTFQHQEAVALLSSVPVPEVLRACRGVGQLTL